MATTQSRFEADVLEALNGIRDQFPAWTETIQLGIAGAVVNFGGGVAITRTVEAPTGYKGRVVGVAVYRNSVTFTAGGSVDVGTTANKAAYYTGGLIPTGTAPQHPEGTFNGYIPGGRDFVITMNPTTNTPTGQAAASVTIEWYEE